MYCSILVFVFADNLGMSPPPESPASVKVPFQGKTYRNKYFCLICVSLFALSNLKGTMV